MCKASPQLRSWVTHGLDRLAEGKHLLKRPMENPFFDPSEHYGISVLHTFDGGTCFRVSRNARGVEIHLEDPPGMPVVLWREDSPHYRRECESTLSFISKLLLST